MIASPRRARLPLVSALAALLLTVVACGGGDPPAGSGNPAGVGNYCAKDDDCATGNCYLGPGGGYCTTSCADEGSTSQCPFDTVCKPIQGGARRCLLICGSGSACDGDRECARTFCPSGSSCVNVSKTDHQACEPEPG
jgi:hypothetical protein